MNNGQREFTLRGGRITLHTIPTDKNGIWQCRLRLEPKLNKMIFNTGELTSGFVEGLTQ